MINNLLTYMVYDIIDERYFGIVKIQYGVKFGSDVTVFIKTGRGGKISGENDSDFNSYIKLTEAIYNRFGYTVVVSDNPENENRDNPLIDDLSYLLNRFGSKKIIYIGYSSGANYGAWYGFQFKNIVKMLLINPILNFNFHRTLKCINDFDFSIEFVMGENDPSAKWVEMIPCSDRVRSAVLAGQTHRIEYEIFEKVVLDFLAATP